MAYGRQSPRRRATRAPARRAPARRAAPRRRAPARRARASTRAPARMQTLRIVLEQPGSMATLPIGQKPAPEPKGSRF